MLKFFKHTAYLLVAAKVVMAKNKEQQPPEVTPKGKDIILNRLPSNSVEPAPAQ